MEFNLVEEGAILKPPRLSLQQLQLTTDCKQLSFFSFNNLSFPMAWTNFTNARSRFVLRWLAVLQCCWVQGIGGKFSLESSISCSLPSSWTALPSEGQQGSTCLQPCIGSWGHWQSVSLGSLGFYVVFGFSRLAS